jgi:hypothetical protein
MSQQRGIGRVVNPPAPAPGFVGPGHRAAPVVSPVLRSKITSVLPCVMPHEKAGSATSILTMRTERHGRTCYRRATMDRLPFPRMED